MQFFAHESKWNVLRMSFDQTKAKRANHSRQSLFEVISNLLGETRKNGRTNLVLPFFRIIIALLYLMKGVDDLLHLHQHCIVGIFRSPCHDQKIAVFIGNAVNKVSVFDLFKFQMPR